MSAVAETISREREVELRARIDAVMRRKVLTLIRRYGVRNEPDVDDIAQEALLALWRAPHALEPENVGLFKAIVRRQVQMWFRAESRCFRSLDPRVVRGDEPIGDESIGDDCW